MSQFKTPQFLALKAKWYKKLETKKSDAFPEGYKDIEQDENNLKNWDSLMFLKPSKHDVTRFTAKETYYQMAGQFLEEFEFETAYDKRLWQYHSEGLTERELAKKLRKKYSGNINADIKRLRTIMLSKYAKKD